MSLIKILNLIIFIFLSAFNNYAVFFQNMTDNPILISSEQSQKKIPLKNHETIELDIKYRSRISISSLSEQIIFKIKCEFKKYSLLQDSNFIYLCNENNETIAIIKMPIGSYKAKYLNNIFDKMALKLTKINIGGSAAQDEPTTHLSTLAAEQTVRQSSVVQDKDNLDQEDYCLISHKDGELTIDSD